MLDRRFKSRPEAVLFPEFILITRMESEYIPVCLVVYEGGGNIGSKAFPVSSSVTSGIGFNIPGLGPSKMHLWPCNSARTGEKSNRLALGMVPVSLHSDVNIIILASGCREQWWQSWEYTPQSRLAVEKAQVLGNMRTCDLLCVKKLSSQAFTHPKPHVLARSGC
jgi:hypothetical protein